MTCIGFSVSSGKYIIEIETGLFGIKKIRLLKDLGGKYPMFAECPISKVRTSTIKDLLWYWFTRLKYFSKQRRRENGEQIF